jgi:hypothetical protein
MTLLLPEHEFTDFADIIILLLKSSINWLKYGCCGFIGPLKRGGDELNLK